jgi:pimeloyl-ACP methyl ester carboxylesterase
MTVFADVRGAKIAYEISGNGPPLLLIHGAEGTRRSFDKVVPELCRDFAVVTYDQRDCGDTENPETIASICDLAADAYELMSKLGYPESFVFGTSFGGRVAQAMAINYPDMVQRLILASTWQLSMSLIELNGEVANEVAALRGELPESAERIASFFFPEAFLVENPSFRKYFSRAKMRSDRSRRRERTVDDAPNLSLARVQVRTLLIAGEADRLVPQQLTLSMKNEIQDVEVAVLPGVGHVSCVQNPGLIVSHIKRFCI